MILCNRCLNEIKGMVCYFGTNKCHCVECNNSIHKHDENNTLIYEGVVTMNIKYIRKGV